GLVGLAEPAFEDRGRLVEDGDALGRLGLLARALEQVLHQRLPVARGAQRRLERLADLGPVGVVRRAGGAARLPRLGGPAGAGGAAGAPPPRGGGGRSRPHPPAGPGGGGGPPSTARR